MKHLLWLSTLCTAGSLDNTTTVINQFVPSHSDSSGISSRGQLSLEIDFKDDLLNNVIWFASDADGKQVLGLSDTGHIVSFAIKATVDEHGSPVATLMSPLLDSDGTPLTVETYVSGGSVVSGDLTLSSGMYAGFVQGSIREFPQISLSSGSVAKSSNPVALCDTWLSEEIAAGCSSGEPASILASVRTEDESETVGSILVSCRVPNEDLSIRGWSCNPSNGDSLRFSTKTPGQYTSLSAMSPCAACDPYQMFFLFTHSDSAGTQKSVTIESIAADSLTDEEDQENRIVLFSLETPDIVFLSLSVIQGTDSQLAVYLFGYNISSPTTAYVILSYGVDINPSTSAKIAVSSGDDYSLSVFILFLLLCVGIAIPFLIRFNPHIRARIENVRWLKNAERIGLVGDSGDESDPEDARSSVPKKFGNNPAHTPKQLKPISELNISGS
jgi:hypothetical protein